MSDDHSEAGTYLGDPSGTGGTESMIYLELEATYPDRAVAEAVMNALGPDNEGYVTSELRGSTIIFRTEAQSAGTMRNTADDLMACIKVAEESVGMACEENVDPQDPVE